MNVQGKNVVIYGGGISGLSAYQLVKEKGGRVMIFDDFDRPHTTSSAGVFARADLIVLSPGIESGNPYVLDARLEGKTVVSEIELASSFCVGEQIAVTGTNGKTTTVTLIDHILKCAHVSSRAVGNIGVAFSSIADKLDALDTAVIEVGHTALQPNGCMAVAIGVATGLSAGVSLLDGRHHLLQQEGTVLKGRNKVQPVGRRKVIAGISLIAR